MAGDWTEGLYDALVTGEVRGQLAALGPSLRPDVRELLDAEAADRLSRHVADLVARVIDDLPEGDRNRRGAQYAMAVTARLAELADLGGSPDDVGVGAEPRLLQAILRLLPTGAVAAIGQPLTPLSDTTLLTNASGEPAIAHELRAEIDSAASIDVVMAFIRRSGILPLLPQLRRHGEAGRPMRVLTTTYTGTTEARALDELAELGAEVKVSYDLTTTRLHAKAWIFHRSPRTTTAYLGSSNLTHSAQHDGLEWNVRLASARNPDVVSKMAAVFDTYWENADFVDYDPLDFRRRTAVAAPSLTISPVAVELRGYQEALLERIAVSRLHGHHRNLLVAATGTGKTVMAAVDYARLARVLPRGRLLFVAHREELLQQARLTFAQTLQDPSFGEMWVRGQRPDRFDHVFASVQSLSRADVALLAPDHFDVVVVDEFHHAAAPTYEALLDHLAPAELLGLTATPERTDGLDVLRHFDGRIAAELRLWDAVAGGYLAPFTYYGVYDSTDLSAVPWRRGRGYDPTALTDVLTADHAWARLVIEQVRRLVTDPSTMRAIGFCVSVAHARFMADRFAAAGIASVAVSADTPHEERERSLRDLRARRVNVVFAVDLFNEGVDVPEVDTLLMLRPTDSGLLFIQQLGRGLRRSEGKAVCTVVDFVGQHRKEFRYDRRYGALLGAPSRQEVGRAVAGGFPFLPAGCSIQLDPVAQEVVLRSIRSSLPRTVNERAAELRALGDCTLGEYLGHTGLELEDVYAGPGHSWSALRRSAGLPTEPAGPEEASLLAAVGRLLHIDDRLRIDTYRRWLRAPEPPPTVPGGDGPLARMLLASLVSSRVLTTVDAAAQLLWLHPQVRAELVELLDVLDERISHLEAPLGSGLPLRVHARYTRIEIQAGLGHGSGLSTPAWREGVLHLPDVPADVFVFTLDKTAGSFSPTTRYRDYAVSPHLIHWESQSSTSVSSPTGRRYIDHAALGSSIMLFARLRTTDRAFWCLGPATYVRHEGDRPIAFTWRLDHPLPGDLFSALAAAAV